MPEKAAVFKETYNDYRRQIAAVDLSARAEILGGALSGAALRIRMCGKMHTISETGIVDDTGGKVAFAGAVLLFRYVLSCPETIPPEGEWVTFRYFRNAAPLVGYFDANVRKVMETAFCGKTVPLASACMELGGARYCDGAAYDLSMTLPLLPRVPALIRFNDKEEEFPPQALILFRESAAAFLDMESLAIGGTLLAEALRKRLGPRHNGEKA